jgi:hypothetical protein
MARNVKIYLAVKLLSSEDADYKLTQVQTVIPKLVDMKFANYSKTLLSESGITNDNANTTHNKTFLWKHNNDVK